MLQRLLILLAQVQADNKPENQPNKNQHVLSKEKFQKTYTIVYSNQYTDEYNINE